MKTPRTPERLIHYSTAEGQIRGDGIPPCPEWIQGRMKRELWAKAAAILSRKHPMKAMKIARLEDAFRDLGSEPCPSPSYLARKVNLQGLKEKEKQRQEAGDTPEAEA